MNKLGKLFGTLFWGVVCAALCIVAFMTFVPKIKNQSGLQNQREYYQAQIEKKKKILASYKEKQKKFETERSFVEQLLRERKIVKAGELVFVFDNRQG